MLITLYCVCLNRDAKLRIFCFFIDKSSVILEKFIQFLMIPYFLYCLNLIIIKKTRSIEYNIGGGTT